MCPVVKRSQCDSSRLVHQWGCFSVASLHKSGEGMYCLFYWCKGAGHLYLEGNIWLWWSNSLYQAKLLYYPQSLHCTIHFPLQEKVLLEGPWNEIPALYLPTKILSVLNLCHIHQRTSKHLLCSWQLVSCSFAGFGGKTCPWDWLLKLWGSVSEVTFYTGSVPTSIYSKQTTQISPNN